MSDTSPPKTAGRGGAATGSPADVQRTAGRYVARSTKVAARMVGDEMMIMSGRDSTLFALNPTAAVIWEAADGVTPIEDIVENHICTKFDVEPATALDDARKVVEQLAGHGLLTVSNAPIGTDAERSRN